MFSRIVYIVNPASQNGATGRMWPEIARALPASTDVRMTTGQGDAISHAREAAVAGADLIVSVGGDGTLNEVTSGLMLVAEDKRPALAMFPQGTGGDFRRTLGYPSSPAAVSTLINRGHTRAIDVGHLQYKTASGADSSRYFINICSFGLSGCVDEAVNNTTKMLGGKASFLIGTMRAFLKWKPLDVEVALDEQPFVKTKVMFVAVCNGRAFGGGMLAAPTADPSDGRFEVLTVMSDGLNDLLNFNLIYKGEHIGQKTTRYEAAKRVRARSAETVLLDVDGEQLGLLPIEINLMRNALRFVV